MPKIFDLVKKKMGLKEEDYVMLKDEYWDADETSIRNNIKENYIYAVKPSLKDCDVKTCLWCGDKEPYALSPIAF